MNCGLVERHVGAFLDGELSADAQLAVEGHLAECPDCADLLESEAEYLSLVRESLKVGPVPEHVVARIHAALDALPEAEGDDESPESSQSARGLMHIALPAAAALMLGFIGTSIYVQVSPEGASSPESRTGALAAAPEASAVAPAGVAAVGGNVPVRGTIDPTTDPNNPLLDVVRLHSSGLPADVSAEPQRVANYFRGKVSFPVQPARLGRGDARFVGARLSNVREKRAAALYYTFNGRRVTLVVVDDPHILARAGRATFGGREVLYHDVGAHRVPLVEHRGLTYAITGDLDSRTLMQLAASLELRD